MIPQLRSSRTAPRGHLAEVFGRGAPKADEVVVGVIKPVRKDLDVNLAYTADVLPNKQVAIFPVVGLLPMALAFGVGTEANQPLAIAVIGGLMVSTFFTLMLIPTLYVMFEERFPRMIAPIENDGAPPRREAPAQ